jgi:uncharacterized membrane-anchored protein YhcB (DUF1043 family)
MRNESVITVGLLIGTIIGGIIVTIASAKVFSKYTLNCVEQNMTLKQMAFKEFPNDYKLRFNDWNITSSTPKEKE